MRALVVGASGQVGGQLMATLRSAGCDVQGTYWRHPSPGLAPLDVRDSEAVEECVRRTRADVVFLAAALSNVDYCERHPDESHAINVTPAQCLARAGVRVVYFSSDYVFAGDAGPYSESDPVRPLSVYGRHKLSAEEALPSDALIVRTTVVYGSEPQRKNFIYRLVDTLRAGKSITAPTDQLGSPTYAPNLAEAVVHLERTGLSGVFNVSGPERASRYAFAREAAAVFGLDADLVRPTTTSVLGQVAPRPLNAGLMTDKARGVLPFPLTDYHVGLRLFREAMAATA